MIFLLLASLLLYPSVFCRDRWTEDQANQWYANLNPPYIQGSQYITSDAGNQLEMFQADTFNPALIDVELGWAESLGSTTMRIFLHDLAYSQDPTGFKSRLETVIQIASSHGIKPLLTIFDSDWNPNPAVGKQPDPRTGAMMSAWLQSPGIPTLNDNTQWPRLETYVKDIVGAYANDARVLGWDLWNEPDGEYDDAQKAIVTQLLPMVFDWARSVDPIQPLTTGVWRGNYGNLDAFEQMQINQSDIVSFHSYDDFTATEQHITDLQTFNRPVLCSEFMARSRASTFPTVVPVFKRHNVGYINWGFVNGKTQCNYPWDSGTTPYTTFQPYVWFHEVFRNDGTPYMVEEAQVIKRANGCPFGFKSVGNNRTCYNAANTLLSYDDAVLACHNNYSVLGSIDSSTQNSEVLAYVQQNYPTCNQFYIGLNWYKDDWYWQFQLPFDSGDYTNWRAGFPTTDPTQSCVVLNVADGTWTNQACTNQQCYLCSY